MRRRLADVLTILSLLLCAAFVALWARSFFTTDIVRLGAARLYKAASGGGGVMLESLVTLRRQGDWRIGSVPGGRTRLTAYTETRVHYFESRRAASGPNAARWERLTYPYTDRPTFDTRAWAHVDRPVLPQLLSVDMNAGGTYDNGTYRAVETWYTGRAVWIPYWLLAAATALPPALWLRNAGRRRRRERRRLNLCPTCGYDLRATPGRCPECGAVADPATP